MPAYADIIVAQALRAHHKPCGHGCCPLLVLAHQSRRRRGRPSGNRKQA